MSLYESGSASRNFIPFISIFIEEVNVKNNLKTLTLLESFVIIQQTPL